MDKQWAYVISVLFCLLNLQMGQAAASQQSSPSIDVIKTGQELPFSFLYNGKRSAVFISRWKRAQATVLLPGGVRHVTRTYTDPNGQLEITYESFVYPEFHAVEWLLLLKNVSKTNTPIIQDIRPLDLQIPRPAKESVIFHYAFGSGTKRPGDSSDLVPDYTPVDKSLGLQDSVDLAHYIFQNGKHTQSYLPFFNVQWSAGGLIGAIGWTGQWMSHIQRSERGLTLQAEQKETHFILYPGEQVRTPSILLLQWEGNDHLVGQNQLRRLLITHYLPRINGQVPMPPIAHTGAYVLIFDDIAKKTGKNPLDILPGLSASELGTRFASPNAALNYVTEENQLALIRTLPDIGFEAYWLDAGWFRGDWPEGRGSWVPNENFPDGLRPLGEAAHKKGLKFLLWFEPEAVSAGSVIAREHPEWVLHQARGNGKEGIFLFSDAAALAWMTDLLSKCIRDWGVDILRIDRNINPLPFWEAADTPDRQGITEIRQIEGFYGLWDGLLKRFPKLEIDNANWRITGPDLEVMKRSLGSLTRTEIAGPGIPYPVEEQATNAELSLWVPLHATLLHAADTYDFRSAATTGVAIGLDLNSSYVPISEIRKGVEEIKALRPYWLGDFFPLMNIDRDETAWAGWQLHRKDMDAGFAMVFRRSKSPESDKVILLHEIDPRARYEVSLSESFDQGPKQILTGEQLRHLHLSLPSPRSSFLVRYAKITNRPS